MTYNIGDIVDFHIESGGRWRGMEVYSIEKLTGASNNYAWVRSTDGSNWLFSFSELKPGKPLYEPADFECDI